ADDRNPLEEFRENNYEEFL
nr:RecName: Full=L-amino-acid oxidase ACTX-8; Short=LAAO; Short=LAO [Deinagkistrodon acutus]